MMIGRPFSFKSEVTRFVILFVERAGSTYLLTALKSHRDVLALTEKLGAMRQQGKSAAEQLFWTKQFLAPSRDVPYRAVGFKTKLVDVLDPEGFAQILRHQKCRIIRLQRHNSIKAVVSTINARRQWQVSGNWNLLSQSNRLPSFSVDLDEFDALLKQREIMDRELEDFVGYLGLPTLHLHYEELLRDKVDFVSRVFAFLGVELKPAQGITLKNTQDDLREAVLNFDELRAKYQGTRYETLFDEVLIPS